MLVQALMCCAGNIGDDSDDSDDSSVKPQVDADGYDPLAVDFDFDVSERCVQ